MATIEQRVREFMDEHVYPAEAVFEAQLTAGPSRWQVPPIVEELKSKARAAGLWNLFLPPDHGLAVEVAGTTGLSNAAYAPLCELMGRSMLAPEAFNCSAPDTGNMEVLLRYGTPAQQQQWLWPLLRGEMRSCFAMTEPAVASSDATNIECSITRDGDNYVINGRKSWISGALDPRCAIAIVMGKTDAAAPRHAQQSMVLVPMNTPGIELIRPMRLFGYDDAPHGHAEMVFRNVRVPTSNILLGEGRGFEIAQGRLGPGRIHHCMRLIGLAERALTAMCTRAHGRVAFGKPLAEQGALRHDIARSRIEIDQARLLTMDAAHAMDTVGIKHAKKRIAMIKVVAPSMALAVIDRAMQVHGAAGLGQDFPLAFAWAGARALRLADGPDEVHLESIAKQELAEQVGPAKKMAAAAADSANTTATGMVRDMRTAQKLDVAALATYLTGRVDGIDGSLRVLQFDGGQSNPTYLLQTDHGRWVLRKKPTGTLLPTAHLIEREYQITTALATTAVPVPRAALLCEDASILGTAFFVMDYVHGRILRDPALPTMSPGDRRAAYQSMITTLAALHDVDFVARGLEQYGKPQGYVERQIARWSKQYQASKARELPAMDWLLDWLPRNVPVQTQVGIVHGDFRIDNMVFHPTEPRVIAVLDWELSTIGDPLTDVAYHCLAFHLRREQRGVPGLIGHDLVALGIPSEREIVGWYCAARGLAEIPNWSFCVAFALFRLAAIAEGVYARMRQGNANTDAAATVAHESAAFAAAAQRVAQAGLGPQG